MSRLQRSVLLSATCMVALVVACSDPEATPTEPSAPPEATPTDSEAASLARAEKAAKSLGKTLKTRLLAAMAERGPEGAVTFCAEGAQDLSNEVVSTQGAGVHAGRASLRLRNTDNAGPTWVREWLEAQGEGPAEAASGVSAVVDGEARFLAPIAVAGPCLTCHGDEATVPEAVGHILAERYPQDRARGYAVGDLRGALWATADVR